MKCVAVFSNKGGLDRAFLVYHLAWICARLDYRVLVADLDPQANLTSMFLADDEVEALWSAGTDSVHGALRPLLDGADDVAEAHILEPEPGIGLIAGDPLLSGVEDELSRQWPDCLDGRPRPFRVLSALWRVLRSASDRLDAQLVLVDVGPNLGPLSRAALLAADHVVVPLAPDLYSIQALRDLGPALRRWREEWTELRQRSPIPGPELPRGSMEPVGYVVLPHIVRLSRPKPFHLWMQRIPQAYASSVARTANAGAHPDADPHCLATLKYIRTLLPLAEEARKPVFDLRVADGAIGGHAKAVASCYDEFAALAREVARRCDVPRPQLDGGSPALDA